MPPKQLAYEIKGTIRFEDGFPADGVKVSAFDRDLRKEELLGQTQTDEKIYEQSRTL